MYGKLAVNKEDILDKVSPEQIFHKYIGDFVLNKLMSSPLREDNHPSFIVGDKFGEILFKDFATGKSGNCFDFVKLKYSLSYSETLKVIANDFDLSNFKGYEHIEPEYLGIPVHGTIKKVASDCYIRVKRKQWSKQDVEYWKSYGWNKKLVDEYNISPIKTFWINGNMINCNSYSYCYYFGNYKYKIYQPFNKKYKFINNASGIIQGYTQLPKKGDILFITSSMKDLGTLKSVGYNSIAPQSENTPINFNIIDELKDRFKKIFIFYDGDIPGIEAAKLQSELYDIPYIYLENSEPSDFYKSYGEKQLDLEIKKLIE